MMLSAKFIMLSSGGGLSTTGWIIYMVAILAVMYLVMGRGSRKQQKEQAARLASLAVGDSVRTSGGFIGTVIDIDEAGNTVIVEFGNNKNCRIPMIKEAIVEVEKPEDAIKEVPAEPEKKGGFLSRFKKNG